MTLNEKAAKYARDCAYQSSYEGYIKGYTDACKKKTYVKPKINTISLECTSIINNSQSNIPDKPDKPDRPDHPGGDDHDPHNPHRPRYSNNLWEDEW